MNARPSTLRQGIAARRAQSGLGVGCAEAQADGVPCEDLARDCDHCRKAGEAASGELPRSRHAGGRTRLSPPPKH